MVLRALWWVPPTPALLELHWGPQKAIRRSTPCARGLAGMHGNEGFAKMSARVSLSPQRSVVRLGRRIGRERSITGVCPQRVLVWQPPRARLATYLRAHGLASNPYCLSFKSCTYVKGCDAGPAQIGAGSLNFSGFSMFVFTYLWLPVGFPTFPSLF